ncbi:MAG TPA: dihydrodipicolinate reductase C-terminal domain-containing protein [Thermoanaerobaculia bacterium]|nr:dihydrodipicolinate reductase C-terminal domain-containing protein [Thermoanaerobaculia bacterium]
MKIAIHGYGKMGKAVERVARKRGHEITTLFSSKTPVTSEALRGADVAIDFSSPAALEPLIDAAAGGGIALVVGTTGWTERAEAIERKCRDAGVAMVHASNFSPGANLVFALARLAAERAAAIGGWEGGIEERHHSQKKDAPSGTALRIAREVREGSGGAIDPPIASSRVGAEFGTHTLFFDSPDDVIEISHKARSRDGFARGAVLAAERIQGMSGVYRFEELISLQEQDHAPTRTFPRPRRRTGHPVPR